MASPQILYEDDDMLVLNKPPGLTVNAAETEKEETLEEWLRQDKGISIDRGGIVHRLDKDTSGVLVVAKTEQAMANLQAQFKERTTQKTYQALVHGYISPREGLTKTNLGRNPKNRFKFAVVEEGREAETAWEVINYATLSNDKLDELTQDCNKNQKRYYEAHATYYSYLTVTPKTGRTHQIRVHLAALRHPIVSDKVYSSRKLDKLDEKWCPRQFLHAKSLTIRQPRTGDQMTFEAPLPPDLTHALTWLSLQT